MSTVIITGASSGIGKEFALQLSKNNEVSEFWLISRRAEKLKEVSELINKPCKILPLDLSVNSDLQTYSAELNKCKPKILFLINAAGYGKYGDYKEVNTEIAFNMIDLNVKALLYITQESIPYFVKGGHIIQLGSASTYHPLPNLNVYASSKAFVKHYSRALSYELKPKNISVTTVCPGWVKTDFFGRANIDAYSNSSFAKPMVEAHNVVKKAIKDTINNKQISMYGVYNNTHHLLAKIFPHKLMIKVWQQMQKK